MSLHRAKPMTDDTSLRRAPRQARGQQRVEKILAAAADLIAEIGYAAATTNAIASRAETSIGSLYQFFPNKEAILEALAEQYTTEMLAVFDAAFVNVETTPVEAIFEALTTQLGAFYSARPAFHQVFDELAKLEEKSAYAHAKYAEIVGRVDSALARIAPRLDAETRGRRALLIVAAMKGLLPLLVLPDGQVDTQMRDDIARIAVGLVKAAITE